MMENSNTALITGAGSGLGRELARQLAQARWAIAGIDADDARLQSLAEELRRRDVRCDMAVADVTDAPTLRIQVDRIENDLGPIDLVIACAGIADDTPAQLMDAEEIETQIRVNLLGVVNTLATTVPAMISRRRGHVVAVSSLAALQPLPRMMAYCASKAGINALMESLRMEVARHGIDVTTVCPGWTRTQQTAGRYRMDDLMPVEESAARILWAIRKRKRFYAYPWQVVWQIRLLRLLPHRWQDWLLCRRMAELRGEENPVCASK